MDNISNFIELNKTNKIWAIGSIHSNLSSFNSIKKFILKNWNDYLKLSKNTIVDPKTKLQEFSLKKFKKLPIYKTVKKSGPNHNPFFQVNVQIQNSKKFQGEGNSKKNAQQNAALKLITNLNI